MKILVTGANGFVGSALVETFLRDGHSVRCLVHRNVHWLDTLPSEYSKNAEIKRGSVTRIETLHAAVSGVDFIFHSAGILRAADKETYYHVNQTGTKNLIEAAWRLNSGLKRFVYISSQAAMGPSTTCEPPDTSAKCAPVSEYGKSKLAGELETLKFADRMPVTVLRPSAIYGPRDKDIFPFFRTVSKFGFFPVVAPSQKCLVQALFVGDLAGICSKIASGHNLKKNIYFVSENRHYTWGDVAEIISRAAGRGKVRLIRIPYFILKFAAGVSDMFMRITEKPASFNSDKLNEFCQTYWLGDAASTEKEFGFNFISLETGVRITYNWYKENGWIK